MSEILLVVTVVVGLALVANRIMAVWESQILASTRQLDSLLPQIEEQLRAYHSLPHNQRSAHSTHIAALLANVQRQMQDVDAVHKPRYQLRVADVSIKAARAGIDFKPEPW